MRLLPLALVLAAVPISAQAQDRGELNSLGFHALMASDYQLAETQLRSSKDFAWNDPAKLINLGHVMAGTGRMDAAADLYRQAISAEECEVILADGTTANSREVATEALHRLRPVRLSSR